jgi:alkanesulfonate monooxygenase SsuD/methylene tetrahydromethanopterin reductase-like flavin-dependent oxidoreductase (luciferase family)
MILKQNPGTSKEMIAHVIRAWSDLLDDDVNGEVKTIDTEYAPPNDQPHMGGSTPISRKPQRRWAVKEGLGWQCAFNSKSTTKGLVTKVVKD